MEEKKRYGRRLVEHECEPLEVTDFEPEEMEEREESETVMRRCLKPVGMTVGQVCQQVWGHAGKCKV
jgi:hypothetical protein